MVSYIMKRILLAAFTLLVISFISFFIVQLPPGDIVDQYIDMLPDVGANKDTIASVDAEKLREEWGLNDPLILQWWRWVSGIIFRADFGTSYTSIAGATPQGVPVVEPIQNYLPYTIYLSIFTAVITWIFSLPVGIYSAVRQHSIGDYVFTFIGFTGLAVPDFLLGLVLMYVAYAYFDHSVGGIFSGDYLTAPWSVGRVIDMLQHLIIPGIVLGTAGTAGLIRVMRNNLLDELDKPYVVTAKAKGMPGWRIIVKYPVRVAINPFISGIGGMLPGLVSGSVIVSIVLSLPTIGPIFLEAVMAQDALNQVAKNEFNKVYGEDYVFLGFRPGNEAVVKGIVSNIRKLYTVDVYQKKIDEIPLMKGINNFKDFDFLFSSSAGFPGTIEWVQYASDPTGVPMASGVTSIQVNEVMPYVQAGQMVGVLAGMPGAAEYESLINQKGSATSGMDAQSVAHLVIVLFIILGNISFFIERKRSKKY